MVTSSLAPHEELAALLAARARAAPDGRLVFDVIAGASVAGGAAVWHFSLWLFPFGAAVCLAMFGLWGITDREITERTNGSRRQFVRILRVVQVLTVVAGILAAIVAAFAVLSVTLGTWIS